MTTSDTLTLPKIVSNLEYTQEFTVAINSPVPEENRIVRI